MFELYKHLGHIPAQFDSVQIGMRLPRSQRPGQVGNDQSGRRFGASARVNNMY